MLHTERENKSGWWHSLLYTLLIYCESYYAFIPLAPLRQTAHFDSGRYWRLIFIILAWQSFPGDKFQNHGFLDWRGRADSNYGYNSSDTSSAAYSVRVNRNKEEQGSFLALCSKFGALMLLVVGYLIFAEKEISRTQHSNTSTQSPKHTNHRRTPQSLLRHLVDYTHSRVVGVAGGRGRTLASRLASIRSNLCSCVGKRKKSYRLEFTKWNIVAIAIAESKKTLPLKHLQNVRQIGVGLLSLSPQLSKTGGTFTTTRHIDTRAHRHTEEWNETHARPGPSNPHRWNGGLG